MSSRGERRLLTGCLCGLVWSLLVVFGVPGEAGAALVRPPEGRGDFESVMDMVTQPHPDGTSSLVLLFSVPNAGLMWRAAADGTWRSQLRVETTFRPVAGPVRRRAATIPLRTGSLQESRSRLGRQVFTLRLDGISAETGHLTCVLENPRPTGERPRTGAETPPPRVSTIEARWVAARPDCSAPSLWIHDPLFLSGAPHVTDGHGGSVTPGAHDSGLQPYLHPGRRYGLGAEWLQVSFDVEAVGADTAQAGRLPRHLLLQLTGVQQPLSLRDTLTVIDDPVRFVARGGVATIAWELDVNQLPSGSYRLSCAPLDGPGNSWLAEFDVLWSLSELTAPSLQGDVVALVVLPDALRREYLGAGPARRRGILARFWQQHDPDPDTRINEAELEFRRRMVYVARYLGGFGKRGPVDDRGLIYLLLGEPDQVQSDEIPLNGENLDNAIGRVFDGFLPRRSGVAYRGLEDQDPVSLQAERERRALAGTPRELHAFEMWIYDGNGRPLFPNPYQGDAAGTRFLFLANGGGVYKLELSNAHQQGTPDG